MNNLSRRHFCKNALYSLGAFTVAPYSASAVNKLIDDDHYFLQIVIGGGWDPSYLFDARPIMMTQKKLIQNYSSKDPTLLMGTNNNSCWVADSAQALLAQKEYFSIVNGVLMAPTFDGHGQNMNYLFTGNPFGGDSFVPYLASKGNLPTTAILGVQNVELLFTNLKNHGEMIPLAGQSGSKLIKYLNKAPIFDTEKKLFQFIQDRYLAQGAGEGSFSLANQLLAKITQQQKNLYNKLSKLTFNEGTEDPESDMISLLSGLFSQKAARVAVYQLNNINVDSHDFGTAASQPTSYSDISSRIAKIINLLRSTAYDDKRSLYDVTTFMVTSEFSRTMRQPYNDFKETGTDHNSLNNSFLIGGKKIKTGQVIGQSDFRAHDEVLSEAHMKLDPDKIKLMASPFDFSTMQPSSTKPMVFDKKNYLNMANLANTVMSLFGVGKEEHWRLDNTTTAPAKTLPTLG